MHYKTQLKLIETNIGFEALVEILHPMESGDRIESVTNQVIAANYISEVVFQLNGEVHSILALGKYIAKNPVVGVRFDALKSGDKVSVHWQDVSGVKEHTTMVVE